MGLTKIELHLNTSSENEIGASRRPDHFLTTCWHKLSAQKVLKALVTLLHLKLSDPTLKDEAWTNQARHENVLIASILEGRDFNPGRDVFVGQVLVFRAGKTVYLASIKPQSGLILIWSPMIDEVGKSKVRNRWGNEFPVRKLVVFSRFFGGYVNEWSARLTAKLGT